MALFTRNYLYINLLADYTRQPSSVRHYATSRQIVGSIPKEAIQFLNSYNSSSRSMTLGSTQLLTEISTRILPGGKVDPARKSDNLTAICEPMSR
jgi:hypothetical protein